MLRPTPIRRPSAFIAFNIVGLIAGVLVGLRVMAIGNTVTESPWTVAAAMISALVVGEVVVFGSRPIWGYV